ncbi:Coiled-coil domain-containing protein 151 [Lamellibrachia satsuma]|nr:Coiled-coil domain-containing protein 151 [Lamellibrachia satsuma]
MPIVKAVQRNIAEQIEDLRRKILLLEGDRKAYYESAEWKMKENREKISKLRGENKELRKVKCDKLAADEHVVNKGLEDHPAERKSLKSKPGAVAVVKMDEKVRDRVNILNKHRDKRVKLQKKLEELRTKYDEQVKDAEEAALTDAGESAAAQRLRNLENQLDKANLKSKEAEHIGKTYLEIKMRLEEEHQTFETTLDDMEVEIKKLKSELQELQTMKNDAIIARDIAKSQLEDQEKEVYAERRKRELELHKVRKEADEKKMMQERYQYRIAARGSAIAEDISNDIKPQPVEEDQVKITTYEQAFHKIKEATGVSDTQEVVGRFENQGETRRQLEEMKAQNEKQISRLREESERLQSQFEEMKYTGEAKLSSGQRILEDFEKHVADAEAERDKVREYLEKASKILTDVKIGVEHLAHKLQHLKAPSSQVQKAKISPTSDEYVLDQLSISEEKLLKLLEEIDQQGHDLDNLIKQMEEEDFHNTIEMKLPVHNTRVKLPTSTKDTMYDEDEDSGEDEDIPTRQTLKRASQQIVESKTRRGRPGKRKKKGK